MQKSLDLEENVILSRQRVAMAKVSQEWLSGEKTIAVEKSQLTGGVGRHNCNLAIVKV